MEKLLHILQHSLGLDKYGQGNQYRNHFVTGLGSDDFDACLELVGSGMMVRRDPSHLTGGAFLFVVTPAGIDYVALNSPKPPKISRSKQRYLDYLRVADCYEDFHHYLKCKEAERKGFA